MAVYEAANAVENALDLALAACHEGQGDLRALTEVVKVALCDRHAVVPIAALDETFDHATLVLEASGGGKMKLEHGNCDDSGHGLTLAESWLQEGRAELERCRDFLLLVDFDEVAGLEILEAVQADAAVEAGSNFTGVVLETSQRGNLTLVHNDVVA